jgi:hypothetical protein
MIIYLRWVMLGKRSLDRIYLFVDDREAEFGKVHHLHEDMAIQDLELLLLRIGFFVSLWHDGCCCNPC